MKSGIAGCIPALNYESGKHFLLDILWADMWLWLSPNLHLTPYPEILILGENDPVLLYKDSS